MASFNLSGGMLNVYNANNLNIANVGALSGSASFALGQTSEGANHTVFDIVQMNQSSGASLAMAGGNNNNTRFTGYNFDAKFEGDSASFWNVELDTANSRFDFTGTQSGAAITTGQSSYNNIVQLGGGKKAIYAEEIGAAFTASGEKETRYYNNMVTDSGNSNVFLSSTDSATRFETTSTSKGAFIAGGDLQDTYYIGGAYGVAVGGSGYNIFTTSNNYDSGFNVSIGGLGQNVYNDYGIKNMYQGAYAFNAYGYNGVDIIRFSGQKGIARVGAELAADDQTFQYLGGSNNYGFTGDRATLTDGTVIDYRQILNGTYANCNTKDGTTWTLKDFFAASSSPSGVAGMYSRMVLQQILE